MALPQAQFQYASDQSLLVVLAQEITLEAHRRIVGLTRLLEREPIAGVRNLHPAYCSLLIIFDGLRWRHAELETVLRSYLDQVETAREPEPRLVEIPVCYDTTFGIDLEAAASACSLSVPQVVEMHSSQEYIVYFLGFVPGFAYLGDLPAGLAVPRLASPRKAVPRGSVAIAGRQTGIYPLVTPGGWRIIGRTPLRMFQPERKEMCVLSIGDRARFVPISREQFDHLERA
jgi:inhibitor of KinA